MIQSLPKNAWSANIVLNVLFFAQLYQISANKSIIKAQINFSASNFVHVIMFKNYVISKTTI